MSPERGKTAEEMRLDEAREKGVPWKQWGPYLSERQWGTVREDYSENGDAWNYFTHDQARSRAYHWGEDGLAGFSDDHQRLCFALALWNGKDPILKERLFGLTNSEGNHGEDVKEYYFYLDSTPTHSYMKYLYKYPQNAYPYSDLIETNRRRGRNDGNTNYSIPAYSTRTDISMCLSSTRKRRPTDILIQISVANRGPEASSCTCCRPCGFATPGHGGRTSRNPPCDRCRSQNTVTIETSHAELGRLPAALRRKSAAVVHRKRHQQRADFRHTQSDALCQGRDQQLCRVGQAGGRQPEPDGDQGRRALSARTWAPAKPPSSGCGLSNAASRDPFGSQFDQIIEQRRREADEFYQAITPARVGEDAANVMRQALAGMLWSKQYFFYDTDKWLEEHGFDAMRPTPRQVRNREWFHMIGDHVISMPDKWEYPWFAAWDLAFHTLALATVDIDFAKQQLDLLLRQALPASDRADPGL